MLPAMVFAQVSHDHSFTEATDSSVKIVLDMAVDNYDKDINCGGLAFWGVQAIEHQTGNRVFGSPRFVPAENLVQEFTFDLPEGDYEEMTFTCSDDGENEAFQFGSIENNLEGDQIIFTASAEAVIIPEITAPLDEADPPSITTSDIDGLNVVTAVPDEELVVTAPEESALPAEEPVIAPQPAALQEALVEIIAPIIIEEQPVEPAFEESITVPSLEENVEDGEIITAPF